MIEEIRSDNRSGAVEVTLKAAEALKRAVKSNTFQTVTELTDYILKTSREIYSAKPAMASLANLAAHALAGAEKSAGVKEGVSNALDNINEFIALMKENVSLVAEHAASAIDDGSSIMTISYSATVAEAAIRARSQGKDFSVYCLESRPMMEGAMLAEVLAGAGIETVLLTDASAFVFIDEMSMAMVGGDTLSPDGLVNKAGTSGLAMAAEKQGIPCYALCSSEKLLPVPLGYQPKLDRYDPRQVMELPPRNLNVINCYFDSTPLERLTGVITEKGLINGDYIIEHFSSLPTRRHVLEILRP